MEVTVPRFTLLMVQLILLETEVQSNDSSKNVSGVFCLRITPNRLQHFEYDSVSLHCETTDVSTKLKGIKNNVEFIPACFFKRTSTSVSCTFDKAYSGDSGEYWCETKEGKRSNSVNITITEGPVILESPALVLEGEAVTLRCCRNKTSSNILAVFYKDNGSMQNAATEEMTITNVSKSNEGVYSCSFSDTGTSPGSMLVVRAREQFLCHRSETAYFLVLLWIFVTVLMLVLLLAGFLYIRKQRGSAGTGYILSLCLKTKQSRKPQRDKEENETSLQDVYANVTIISKAETGSDSTKVHYTRTLNPTSSKCSSHSDEEILYSIICLDT